MMVISPGHRRAARSLACVLYASLALAVPPAVCLADDRSAARLYEQGLQSFNQGDHRAAVIQLKSALQQDPTILPAHILLGRAYLQEGSGGAAEGELKIALGLGADRSSIVPELAQALALQRKYKQLVEEVYPTTGDPAADAKILQFRGDAHVELKELDLAERAFDQAAKLQPRESGPLLGRARVLLERGDPTAAEAEAIAAIQLKPEDSRAWLTRGTIEHRRGDVEAALTQYEKAVSLDPKNVAAQLARLGVLIDLGRDAEAVEAAKSYRKDFPSDPRAAYLQAVVLARLGDGPGSKQALEEAYAILSSIPQEVLQSDEASFLLAGVVAYSLGKQEEALAKLDQVIASYPSATAARKLLGDLLLKRGDSARAIDVLEPVLRIEPNNPRLLLMLGETYRREGRYYQAGELFERALRVTPDSTEARVQRAVNRLAAGQKAAAVEELSAVFEKEPSRGQVGALLAEVYVEQGNAQAALPVLERLVETEPDDLGHRNQLALVLAGLGRIDEARQALDQILVRAPNNTAAEVNLAKLDLLQGRAAEATTRYRSILDRAPAEPMASIGLAQALVAQGQNDQAIGLLEKVQAGPGDIAETHRLDAGRLLAELYIQAGQAGKALQAAQRMELLAPSDPRVLIALGNAYRALGDTIKAQNLYRRLSTDAGYDKRRVYEAAELQFVAGDLEGALWSVTKAAEADPGFLSARVKQVELLGALGRFDKALEAARALAESQPKQPEAQRVLGDVLLAKGDRAGALDAFQRAYALAPSQSAVIRLYKVRIALGQAQDARRLLSDRLVDRPGDRAVREALADDLLQAGDWAAARREYTALVEGGAGTAAQYNNLAVVAMREGDTRAREFAERAITMAPDAPASNDTLGWLLVQSGDPERGLGYLRKAEARAALEPEIQYHIGVALHRLGRPDEARAALERALGANRPFEGLDQAQALIGALPR